MLTAAKYFGGSLKVVNFLPRARSTDTCATRSESIGGSNLSLPCAMYSSRSALERINRFCSRDQIFKDRVRQRLTEYLRLKPIIDDTYDEGCRARGASIQRLSRPIRGDKANPRTSRRMDRR